jgi:hypothetical protein
VRLFQKPLLAMKAMHEMGLKLDAPTALSDPRTGLRAVPQVLSTILYSLYMLDTSFGQHFIASYRLTCMCNRVRSAISAKPNV